MGSRETTVVVAGRVEDAFAAVAGLAADPHVPGLGDLTGGALQRGAVRRQITEFLGRRAERWWTVTCYVPDEQVTLHCAGPPPATVTVRFEPFGDATLLRCRTNVEGRGFLRDGHPGDR